MHLYSIENLHVKTKMKQIRLQVLHVLGQIQKVLKEQAHHQTMESHHCYQLSSVIS